jgi:hypothetical protein
MKKIVLFISPKLHQAGDTVGLKAAEKPYSRVCEENRLCQFRLLGFKAK